MSKKVIKTVRISRNFKKQMNNMTLNTYKSLKKHKKLNSLKKL